MSGVKLPLAFLLLFGVSACAQTQPAKPVSKSSVDLFASYLYGGGKLDQSGSGIMAGADVSRLYKWIGLTAEFSLTNASKPDAPVNGEREVSFLAGPRFSLPVANSSRIAPFADVLVGADAFHNGGQQYTWVYNNHTSLAWAVDGGVDLRLTRHLFLRGQGGYLGSTLDYSTYSGPASPATTSGGRARVGAGLVFRF